MMTEEKKKYHKRRGMSERILDVLSDGHWHSVQEVSKRIGYPYLSPTLYKNF